MTAFLYNRVSHKDSADSGLSIEDQIEKATSYATTVIPRNTTETVIDNGVSAWSKTFASRPGGRYILSEARSGDHVICYSINRLCRNLRDFCNVIHHFEKAGVKLHFVSEQINTATAAGKLQMHMLAAMAQYASDITSERTREALLIRKLRKGGTVNKKQKRTSIDSEFKIATPAKTKRMPGRVHMYERVSSDSQYTSGLGLEHQTASNKRYAEAVANETGGTIGEVFSDAAISAYSVPFAKRPAGKKLLETMRPGDDVVFYRLDRGFRNIMDAVSTCEKIRDLGGYVHFVCEGIRTDSGVGREWIGMLACIAELESSMKSRRICEVMARCRAKGRPTGTPRFGMKIENVTTRKKKLAIDQDDALQCAQIWILKHEYKLNVTKIEDCLIAIEARKAKKPAKLTMKRRIFVARKLRQIDAFIEMVGTSLWESYKQKARESLKQPFKPEHCRLIRWKHPFTHSEAGEIRLYGAAS